MERVKTLMKNILPSIIIFGCAGIAFYLFLLVLDEMESRQLKGYQVKGHISKYTTRTTWYKYKISGEEIEARTNSPRRISGEKQGYWNKELFVVMADSSFYENNAAMMFEMPIIDAPKYGTCMADTVFRIEDFDVVQYEYHVDGKKYVREQHILDKDIGVGFMYEEGKRYSVKYKKDKPIRGYLNLSQPVTNVDSIEFIPYPFTVDKYR